MLPNDLSYLAVKVTEFDTICEIRAIPGLEFRLLYIRQSFINEPETTFAIQDYISNLIYSVSSLYASKKLLSCRDEENIRQIYTT